MPGVPGARARTGTPGRIEQNRARPRDARHRRRRGLPASGLAAYDGEQPVGWVSVAPLAELTRVSASAVLRPGPTGPTRTSTGRWAITCFVVREEARGGGLAGAAAVGGGRPRPAAGRHLGRGLPARPGPRRGDRPGRAVRAAWSALHRPGLRGRGRARSAPTLIVARRSERALTAPAAPGPRPRPGRRTRRRAVGAVHQEPVEAAGEPAVVGDGEDGALERLEAVLERLGGLHVEVVGGLVEQQQRRAGELEQQDLEPGLLAAARATRTSARRRARARSGRAPGPPARGPCPSRPSAPSPRCRISSRVRPMQLGVLVGLHEPARPHAGAQLGPAGVADRLRPAPRPPAGARRRGRCRRRRAAAGSGTCPSRCCRARPPARRTRPRGRTGCIRPVSSRSSQTTARLPVRPPLSRIVTCCSRGCSVGGPASSNLRSRVWAAWYCDWPCRRCTPPSCLYSSTSALSLACSSSQRRRSSSKRTNRSLRASWYDAKPPGWVHTLLPAAPSSTVTTRVAVLSSSSRSWLMNRIVLSGLADPLLEPDLAGHVEEVVGLVEQQHLVGAAQQELQHQPLLLAAGERAQLAVLGAVVGHARARRSCTRPR